VLGFTPTLGQVRVATTSCMAFAICNDYYLTNGSMGCFFTFRNKTTPSTTHIPTLAFHVREYARLHQIV
jgi:hypothetical protein